MANCRERKPKGCQKDCSMLPCNAPKDEKIVVVSDVIVWVVAMRGQDQTHRSGRKIEFGCPNARWNQKPVVWSVKGNLSLANPIIHQHLETTRCGHKELITFFMGMGTPAFAPRNIVQVKHPLYIERKVLLIFYGRNVTCPEADNRQGYDGCVVNGFQAGCKWVLNF